PCARRVLPSFPTRRSSDLLHATVFTRDIDRALHFARRLPCGTISINQFSEGDVKTPFGGYKRSGSLARDNGTEAIQQYLQTKTIDRKSTRLNSSHVKISYA